MSDPFLIKGPALISFSGGRTSAYMLWRILQAHGGTLPDDVFVTFANTGKEMPQALDFVRDCGERWGVLIWWLEYRDHDEPRHRWRQVSYEMASRNGEPFRALVDRRQYLPNPVSRFCTQDLKINVIQRWARATGIGDCDRVIGFRADERRRLSRIRAREEQGKDAWTVVAPMVEAGTTKQDVQAFWSRQNFDLRLPNINGTTPLGNCDLCFLKGAATIQGIMRTMPDLASWWIEAEAEAEARASKPSGARFRQDRPSYAAMFDAVQRQEVFDFGGRDELVDCFCGEAA